MLCKRGSRSLLLTQVTFAVALPLRYETRRESPPTPLLSLHKQRRPVLLSPSPQTPKFPKPSQKLKQPLSHKVHAPSQWAPRQIQVDSLTESQGGRSMDQGVWPFPF